LRETKKRKPAYPAKPFCQERQNSRRVIVQGADRFALMRLDDRIHLADRMTEEGLQPNVCYSIGRISLRKRYPDTKARA
jgi:hypothetical protein